MTRRKTCPACSDRGPHPVRVRRLAQLLTDTVIVTLRCRMCEWQFDIHENVTPAVPYSPPVRTAGVAQPKGPRVPKPSAKFIPNHMP